MPSGLEKVLAWGSQDAQASGSQGIRLTLSLVHGHRTRRDMQWGHDHGLCLFSSSGRDPKTVSNLISHLISPFLLNYLFQCSCISFLAPRFPSKLSQIIFSLLVLILLHPYPNLVFPIQSPR